MILIGENIHVISKKIRESLLSRDESFFVNLVNLQKDMDCIDLNVGPAKGAMEGVLPWLAELVQCNSNLGISFDTTNYQEMEKGFAVCQNKESAFLNSVSLDEERFSKMADIALNNNCNLIGLTLSKDIGIPKTSDGRLEIAFELYEKCLELGIDSEKLYFDPLILPIGVEQGQALEALNTIKMIKESFDPPVKTIVGLSNISNGCPKELRPLINRVYAVMAYGAGLDAAIVDACDLELIRVLRMLDNGKPKSDVDRLYFRLADMVRDFSDIDDVEFNSESFQEQEIIKCAEVLLNRKIYSNSFTQV